MKIVSPTKVFSTKKKITTTANICQNQLNCKSAIAKKTFAKNEKVHGDCIKDDNVSSETFEWAQCYSCLL